jgi:coniferyl-aldehyde dehydrogenase
VTLELGGKAPAIVAPDFPLPTAAARIATGKWINAGQTCIGVDYVLVDAPRREAFIEAIRAVVHTRFGDLADPTHYTRIINDTQYARLVTYLDDARARGATVLPLVDLDPERARRERLLPPTLVLDAPDDSAIMQHEIFGPILPVKTYRTLDEAVDYVAAQEPPLALYPFSNDRATVERILARTVAGGVTVNDTLWHFGVQALPFGGIGPSGMGAMHGKAGFDTFSKLLPVLRQSAWPATDWLVPPYRGGADWLIRWLAR